MKKSIIKLKQAFEKNIRFLVKIQGINEVFHRA